VSLLTPASTAVALVGIDAMAVPRMTADMEVDDRADRQGPSVRGRERESEGEASWAKR
jgi:hypothetical protein